MAKRNYSMNSFARHTVIRWNSRRVSIATLCALLLFWAVPGQTAVASPDPDDIVRATLDNGLRVIIVRNPLAPVVSTSISYLVGANETPPGFPGTAHALEHMMFRGSPGLSADQLANIGSIMGGSFNAEIRQTVTQYDYTVTLSSISENAGNNNLSGFTISPR